MKAFAFVKAQGCWHWRKAIRDLSDAFQQKNIAIYWCDNESNKRRAGEHVTPNGLEWQSHKFISIR